jgi:phosphoglycolate phosphatase
MLIVFDWDATLVDSADRIADCMVSALNKMNIEEIDHKSAKQIIGLGLDEAIIALRPDFSSQEVSDCKELYREFFLAKKDSPSPLFDGVLETLNELKSAGHFLAVATGKSRQGLDRELRGLNLETVFDATRCADETRSKPHPCMLYELLDEFQYEPHQCIMVGDTTYDMEMAKSISMPCVAVNYGAHSEEQLLSCDPLALIDDICRVKEVIEDYSMVAEISLEDDE